MGIFLWNRMEYHMRKTIFCGNESENETKSESCTREIVVVQDLSLTFRCSFGNTPNEKSRVY